MGPDSGGNGAAHLEHEAEAAIRAVGIRNGAAHTELMLDAGATATVVEIGARVAAGHIGLLIRHALGIAVYEATLDIAIGPPPEVHQTVHGFATVRFITAPGAGRLGALDGLPTVGPGIPYVRQRCVAGQRVRIAASNRDRLAEFVVAGSVGQEVEHRAAHLAARVWVTVAADLSLATKAGSAELP